MKRISASLARWRSAVKRFYIFLLPVRFSLFALAVTILAFVVMDQGRDVFRALAEDRVGRPWIRTLTLLIATNLLAYEIWFWSRHLLRYRPHALSADDPCLRDTDLVLAMFRGWTKWLPRVLGLAVFLIVIIALVAGTGVTFPAKTPGLLWWILALLAVSAGVFWIVVVTRRRVLGISEDEMTAPVGTWKDFQRITRNVLWSSVALEAMLFVWACADATSWWRIGVAATLVLIMAVWVPAGSMLVVIGEAKRVPILTLLLIWGFAISWLPLTDNHAIRTDGALPQRETLEKAFADWHARVSASPRYRGTDADIPVVIVAAEGGGIRAAYWTAAVLSSLQDQVPQFRENCFAISGASGGSMGALLFDELLAEHDPARGPSLHAEARQVLDFDALSGTLAAWAQPDLLQRFVPLGFPDRAKALEIGWETGWTRTIPRDNLFARPFVATMRKHPDLPLLLMNGTLVETGERIITSNVSFRSADGFRNAHDALDRIGTDVRSSTAALLSSRFTFISPAGTIRDPKSKAITGRIIDGGYFENSGAVTASEVVDFVLRKRKEGLKVHPFVVVIDYRSKHAIDRRTMDDGRPFCPSPGRCGPRWPERPTRIAPEVLSPAWGVLNARGARGDQAVGDLAQMLGEENVVEFRLLPRFVPLPLGWVLSQRAQDSMDWSAACEGGNRTAVHRIAQELGVVLREDWKNPVADAALQHIREYVPDTVPCGRKNANVLPQCAREGCGETADERGNE